MGCLRRAPVCVHQLGRDRVKILYGDRDGFAIGSKRLKEGTYTLPLGEGAGERRREITAQELGVLLSGIDLTQAPRRQPLLRELLDAKRPRKSEQLSADQWALFAVAWQARHAEAETAAEPDGPQDDDLNAAPAPGA